MNVRLNGVTLNVVVMTQKGVAMGEFQAIGQFKKCKICIYLSGYLRTPGPVGIGFECHHPDFYFKDGELYFVNEDGSISDSHGCEIVDCGRFMDGGID